MYKKILDLLIIQVKKGTAKASEFIQPVAYKFNLSKKTQLGLSNH
jgi:hypothetical protein